MHHRWADMCLEQANRVFLSLNSSMLVLSALAIGAIGASDRIRTDIAAANAQTTAFFVVIPFAFTVAFALLSKGLQWMFFNRRMKDYSRVEHSDLKAYREVVEALPRRRGLWRGSLFCGILAFAFFLFGLTACIILTAQIVCTMPAKA